jgi:predicted nucleic acid-binding protein
MMAIINKVFLDSSVLIEAIKGSQTVLLERLMADEDYECCISAIVVSEFMFHFLAVNSSVAPLTMKMQKQIPSILQNNEAYQILQHFTFLNTDERIVSLTPLLMQKYNLLPNDAIIMATCKIHNIIQLASLDSELKIVCVNEGITFVSV